MQKAIKDCLKAELFCLFSEYDKFLQQLSQRCGGFCSLTFMKYADELFLATAAVFFERETSWKMFKLNMSLFPLNVTVPAYKITPTHLHLLAQPSQLTHWGLKAPLKASNSTARSNITSAN